MSSVSAHLELITIVEEGVENKWMMKTAWETLIKFLKLICFAVFNCKTRVSTILWKDRNL